MFCEYFGSNTREQVTFQKKQRHLNRMLLHYQANHFTLMTQRIQIVI